ncbi:Uncharacterized protein AXF42_Ash020696 [Apostasia shenzhenica]|uniref:MAPK kinase substrate protein n=1 Tax=Apostasia shenzhenica TaxID=1088818 RepID=A0A2I0AE42_9ASPA|nr:Uncharacterized protein AXF42_Ash020696 [Apostasia shenzhenica]
MAGLQRSTETFRRSGSSGLVWEDRFLPGEMNPAKPKEEEEEYRELRQSHSVGSIGMMERSRSAGAGRAHRRDRVSPTLDPPSPKLSCCALCGIFGGKPAAGPKAKARRR